MSPNPKTFDELLEYPKLAAEMSDEELEKILLPYFPATRPAGAPTSAIQTSVNKLTSKLNIVDIERLAEEARARGVQGM